MTIRMAFSAISRLIKDEWWVNQLKAQRMRWREALLIAAGEVNKDRSPLRKQNGDPRRSRAPPRLISNT